MCRRGPITETAINTVEVNRPCGLAGWSFELYNRQKYERHNAQRELKVCLLHADVVKVLPQMRCYYDQPIALGPNPHHPPQDATAGDRLSPKLPNQSSCALSRRTVDGWLRANGGDRTESYASPAMGRHPLGRQAPVQTRSARGNGATANKGRGELFPDGGRNNGPRVSVSIIHVEEFGIIRDSKPVTEKASPWCASLKYSAETS